MNPPVAPSAPRSPQQVDIGTVGLPPGHKGSYSFEPEEHPDDRRHRLFKETTTFVVCLLVLLAVLIGCVYALTRAGPSVEEKRWLQSTVTLILGGFVGYFLKK